MLKSLALISGFTGQDGSHVAKQRLVKIIEVSEIISFAPAFSLKFLNCIYRDTRNANPKPTFGNEDLVDGENLKDFARNFDPKDITA